MILSKLSYSINRAKNYGGIGNGFLFCVIVKMIATLVRGMTFSGIHFTYMY